MKPSIIPITIVIAIVLLVGGYYVFAGKNICGVTISTSAGAPDHPHRWCSNQEFTEDFCNAQGQCHKHRINKGQNLAEAAGAGPHTHQLK